MIIERVVVLRACLTQDPPDVTALASANELMFHEVRIPLLIAY
jgi:hypothetical protein